MTDVRETTTKSICEDFTKVLARCGYKHDPSYNLGDKPEVARQLGKAFFDYMVASIYDCDWEGFNTLDLQGIAHLIQDFRTAVENGLI